MAPPPNRRPGFSRRAQYSLFLGYVVAVGGILFALMLLVVAVIDPRGFNALKGAALDATTPISSAGRSVVTFFEDIGGNVGNYWNAGTQNAQLKQELAAHRRQLIQARAVAFENRRLQALLRLRDAVPDEIAVGRIVGSTIASSRRFATLSVGAREGVRPGQPVRSPEGLIGRVFETGRWSSRVLLVTDGASNVPVRLVRDGTPAIATGRSDGTIELKTLEVGKNPFRRGDILVTSGIGGVYPPGIPVAVVVSVKGEATVARPTADPAGIDYAIVQGIFVPEAAEPLEGSAPPAAPPVEAPPQ